MNQPTFDHWTSLFLLGALQGLFLAVLLWTVPRGQKSSNRLLGAVVGLFSLMLLNYVAYWSGYISRFPFLLEAYHLPVPLLGPLLWGYGRKLLNPAWKPGKWQALHLLPFLLMLAFWLPFWFQEPAMKYQSLNRDVTSPYFTTAWQRHICIWGQVVQVLAYVGALLQLAYRHPVPAEAVPASSQSVRKRLQLMAWLFAMFGLALLSYYVMAALDAYYRPYDYAISLVMAGMIFAIGYLGFRQPDFLEGVQLRQPRSKYQKASLPESAAVEYAHRLAQLMEHDQLFLQPDLRLRDLAKALGISNHQVSQLLNAHLDQRFSDFVNAYRISYAQDLLREPEYADTPLVQIGYACGFNSKNSFTQAFKKRTGMTPGEARGKLQV